MIPIGRSSYKVSGSNIMETPAQSLPLPGGQVYPAGALDYNPTDQNLYVSNGLVWKALPSVNVSATPTYLAGAGAGTGPTISVTGNNLGGQISVLTGSGPTASSVVATVVFNGSYVTGPVSVVLSPGNANTAALTGAGKVYVGTFGATNFTITVGSSALSATTQYLWNYAVVI